MVKKRHLYSMATAGWMLLVMGATVAVYSGQAEPLVSQSQIPRGPLFMFAAPASVIIVGMIFIGYFKKRSWKAMGRQANLTSDGGSLLSVGCPDLTGTVDGRSVRVRTAKRKTSGGGEGSNRKTVTIVEADLREPAETGVLVGRTGSEGSSGDGFDFGNLSITSESVDGRFVAAADSADLARAVLTEPVREALLAVDTVETLLVGDAAETIKESVPDMSDSFLGGFVENKMEEKLSGDASTVTHELDFHLLDPDELRRQVRAVTAVADAFEDATADGDSKWGMDATDEAVPE